MDSDIGCRVRAVGRVLAAALVALAVAGCSSDDAAPKKPAKARAITSAQELDKAAASKKPQLVQFAGIVLQTDAIPVQTTEIDFSGDEPSVEMSTGGESAIRYVRIVSGPLIASDGAATKLGRAVRPWSIGEVVLVSGGPDISDDDAVTVTARMGKDFSPVMSLLGGDSDFVQAEAVSVEDASERILGPIEARTDGVDDVLLGDTELQVTSIVRGPTYIRFRVQPNEVRYGYCEDFVVSSSPPPATSSEGRAAAQAVERAFRAGDEEFPPAEWPGAMRAIATQSPPPTRATWACSRNARKQLASLARENASVKLTAEERAMQDLLFGSEVSHPLQQTTEFS